jgi:hypothetical protein
MYSLVYIYKYKVIEHTCRAARSLQQENPTLLKGRAGPLAAGLAHS